MKLTQKVDHFTVFKTSLTLVAAHRSSRQITYKKIDGWDVRGSIRDAFIGWVMHRREKVTLQNGGRALVKPKSQPRHLPVPEPTIRAFHITVNSPLLQSASSE